MSTKTEEIAEAQEAEDVEVNGSAEDQTSKSDGAEPEPSDTVNVDGAEQESPDATNENGAEQESPDATNENGAEQESPDATNENGAEQESPDTINENGAEQGSPDTINGNGAETKSPETITANLQEEAAQDQGPPGESESAGSAEPSGVEESVGTDESDGDGGDGEREPTDVRRVEFQPLLVRGGSASGDTMHLLMDVTVPVAVELGSTQMSLREVLNLGPGALVKLQRAVGDPVDILVNGELVGRGEVVVVDDRFGIRVTELLGPNTSANA